MATCASGYTAVGSGVYTCNAAGEWEGESVTCEDIDECQNDNGGCGASASCENTGGSFQCGGCVEGAHLNEETNACEANPCAALAIEHSDRGGDNMCTGGFTDVCAFVCDPGFTAVGEVQCDSSGTFSGGRCEANECTEGLTIPNSNRDADHPCSGFTGDACEFVCHDGTYVEGAHTCGTDGSFTGGTCQVVDCGSTVDSLDPHASATCEGDTGFGGDECVATCNEGFRANADDFASVYTCGADGQWVGELSCGGASPTRPFASAG